MTTTTGSCRPAGGPLDLYRGDFLPEEPYLGGAELKRVALKDQYLAVLMEMVRLFERKGDLEQAARHCGFLIHADPLGEQAHQYLMRLLQRQGRRSAALKVYRNLAEALSSELDIVPDPATTQDIRENNDGQCLHRMLGVETASPLPPPMF
jgi:LuxR family maltose regulon positive regulatory protein